MSALQAHREVLEENITRTRTLLETIDKTLGHVKGDLAMSSEEIFAGCTVPAGKARFEEQIRLAGEPNDCKVSTRDTQGAMSAFEFIGTSGGPRHLHHEQDECIYVLRGVIDLEVGGKRHRLGTGESVLIPRRVAHVWASADDMPTRIIDIYQPAGKIEDFFRQVGIYKGGRHIHDDMSIDQFGRLFEDHGMDLVGPPFVGEWNVNREGRIVGSS